MEKELIILCSWTQRLPEIAEGKLYETFIYDFKQDNDVFKLNYLNKISNHFESEFEGIQDGIIESKAKYKTAIDIKNELKKLNQ